MKELTYTKKGDYQIPDLVMDGAAELASLGRYGRMRRKFLEEHHHGTYISMLLTGSLPGHLQETEQEAQEQMESLMSQMMEAEGVDEELKARDQMTWLQAVNCLKSRAEEIVIREVVYR